MMILHAFDDTSEEIIRPEHVVAPIEGFPETALVMYSWRKLDYLLKRYSCEPITTLNAACAPIPVYRIDDEGESYAAYLSLIGGPAASGIMEEIITIGARRFLFFGSCGVLDNDILSGHIAVPTSAYRDEGTSYHYLPPSAYIDIPTADRLADVLQGLGVPYHLTRTWTTDAMYRETRTNMERRRAEGCRVVDMECASTAAVAHYRSVEFYQFFHGSDSLAEDEWNPRDLLEGDTTADVAAVDLAVSVARKIA